MRFKSLLISLFIILILIFIVLPSFISTQDTIGSTYIELKDLSRIYSAKLEYRYSSNEILLKDSMNNILSINEDGYIGLKNNNQVIYLPSKIYHKNNILYAPIEITSAINNNLNHTNHTYQEVDFDPVFELEWNNNSTFKYIIIDPGHGGKDPGATNEDIYEKDIVLDVAFKLKKELMKRSSNLIIIMTRTEDKELSKDKSEDLRKRAEIGSNYATLGSGLFISIHANATPITDNKENVKGIETWYYYPNYDQKNESTYSNEINEYRKIWVNKVYNIKTTNDNFPYIDTNIGKYSSNLANIIHKSLLEKLEYYTYNRGIKKGVFQVLRESVIPAILCEIGFISNTDERKLLTNSNYQQKIAEGLADGILNYINIEYPILSAYK